MVSGISAGVGKHCVKKLRVFFQSLAPFFGGFGGNQSPAANLHNPWPFSLPLKFVKKAFAYAVHFAEVIYGLRGLRLCHVIWLHSLLSVSMSVDACVSFENYAEKKCVCISFLPTSHFHFLRKGSLLTRFFKLRNAFFALGWVCGKSGVLFMYSRIILL